MIQTSNSGICIDYGFVMFFAFIVTFLVYYLVHRLQKIEAFRETNLYGHLEKGDLLTRIKNLQSELLEAKLQEQRCQLDLEKSRMHKQSVQTPTVSTDTSTRYPVRQYESSNFQNIGYVYNVSSGNKYPLYGRTRYRRRSDKWEYYIVEDSENKIRIPYKSRNDNELSTGDVINIRGVTGDLQVELYELDQPRYNPDLM